MATLPNPNPLTNNAVANYSYFVDPTATIPVSGANISNDVSTFVNMADPQITKTVDMQYADVNDMLTYTLIIKNSGNMTAENVIITDTTPNGTTFVQDSIKVNGAAQTGAVLDPPTGLNIGNILPNGTTTIVWNVVVNTLPSPNPIPNSATEAFTYVVNPTGPVTTSGNRYSNIVNTQVNTANITGGNLVKSVTPEFGKVGDVIRYTITMLNTGNVTANNVIFTDTIPTYTTFQSNSVTINGTPQTGANPAPPTGVTIGSIGPNSKVTLTFNVVLTSLPATNPIPNEGKISYNYTTNPSIPNGQSTQALTNIANVSTNQAVIDNANGGGMVKSVDKNYAQVGDILTYSIGLKNTGNVTATNVVFTDTIPNGTSFISDSVTINGTPQTGANPAPPTGVTIGTIAPGAASTIVFQVIVNTIPTPNPIPNNSTVKYNYTTDPSVPDGATGVGNSNQVTTQINQATIDNTNGGGLIKAVDKTYAQVGDVLTYTITLKNTGNTAATNVVFTDTIPNGTSFISNSVTLNGTPQTGANPAPPTGIAVGTIGAGSASTIIFKVTVNTIPTPNPIPNNGTVNYNFTIDPSTPNGGIGSGNTNTVNTTVNQATIDNANGGGLVKAVDKTYAKVGDILTYTITLQNTGNVSANNVIFTDTIPSGTSFVANSVSLNGTNQPGVSPAPPTGVPVGTIGPGLGSTVIFKVVVNTVPNPNPIPNNGTVKYSFTIDPSIPNGGSSSGNSNTVNTQVNQATIDNTNGGGLVKSVDKAYANVGDTVTYTITLKNTGNVTADNVVLTDTIPSGTSFITDSVFLNGTNQLGANPAPPIGITIGAIGPNSASTVVFKVTVNTIPNPNPIPNNSTVNYTYTVDPLLPNGESASGNSNTVNTQVNNASFSNGSNGIVKSVDKVFAKPGDILNYTIVLKNTGNVTANNVVFTDTLPGGITFVSNSVKVNNVPQSGANPNPPIGITIGSIGPNVINTITFQGTVNQNTNPNPIDNQGKVAYAFTVNPASPNGVSNQDLSNTVSTQVNQAVIDNTNGGGMVKAVDKAYVQVGETVTYTIGLKNTGNVTATNVVFTDTIPNGTSFISNSVTINGTPQTGANPAPPTGINVGLIAPNTVTTIQFQVIVNTIPNPNPIPNNSTVKYNYTIDPSVPNGQSGSGNSNTVNTQVNQATIDNTTGGGLVKYVTPNYSKVGDTITYTIGLKNTGNVTANNVQFIDTIPNGTSYVLGSFTLNGVNQPSANPQPPTGVNIGSIGPSKTSTVTFKVVVDTIPNPNPIPNIATAAFTFTVDPANPNSVTANGNTNLVNTQVNQAISDNASGGLVKSVDKQYAAVGDVLNYTIGITNTGNTTANNVVFIDTIPSGTTFVQNSFGINGVSQPGISPAPPTGAAIGNVGPGLTTTVTFSVVVNTIPTINPIPNSGNIKFNYTIDPSVPNGGSGSGNSNIVNTQINQATIDNTNGGGLVKAVDKAYADVGDTVTYTITLKNTGNVQADNVVFTDTIPTGTTFVSNSVTVDGITPSGAPNPQSGINLGSINAGGVSTVIFQVVVNTIPTQNPIPNAGTVTYAYTTDPAVPDGRRGSGNTNTVTTQVNSGNFSNAPGGAIKAVDKAYAQVGEILTYTVTLKNTGNVTSNNIVFTDTIPTGTTFVTSSVSVNGTNQPSANPAPPTGINIGSLGPGVASTIIFKVMVNTIPIPNPIVNEGKVAYTYTVNPAVPNGKAAQNLTNDVTTEVNQATIDNTNGGGLVKAVDKQYAKVNDVLTYTISMTNTGNVTANNVVLTDTIPSGTSFIANSVYVNGSPVSGSPTPPTGINVGNIVPGSTATLVFQVTVNTIPNPNPIPNASTVKYNFVVNPNNPNGVTGSGNSNIVNTKVNTASIDNNGVGGNGLNKAVNTAYAAVGDTINYTVVLKNTGNVSANNVIFTDTMPNGLNFVNNSFAINGVLQSGANPAPPTGVNVGNISPGQVVTLTFNALIVSIPNPNPALNTGTVTYAYTMDPSIPNGEIGSGNSNMVSTQVSGGFDWTTGLIKSVDKKFAKINDTLTYDITINNNGNTTLGNILVKDTIPTGTSFIANSVTIDGAQKIGYNPQTGISISQLGVGATTTIQFNVKVSATVPNPNPILNNAVLTYTYTVIPTIPNGRSGGGISNTVSTAVNSAIINNSSNGLVKSVDKTYADINDVLTYTINLRNTGNVTANNIVLTDTVPNGTTFIDNTVFINGVIEPGVNPGTGINIPFIAPGAAASVTFQVNVNTMPNPNPIPNNAIVNYQYTIDPANQNDGNDTNITNTVTTQVNNATFNNGTGQSGIVKTVDKAYAQVGNVLNYTVKLQNLGNVTANNVQFTDTIPSGTTYSTGSFTLNGVVQSGANPQNGVNVGSIAPNAVATVSFKVVVNTIPNPNPIPNNAFVNYSYTVNPSIPNGKSGANLSNWVNTQVNQANIDNTNGGGLVKYVDKKYAKVSDVLTYTIGLSNTGNADANNILFTDTIPNGTTFIANSVFVDGINNPGVSPAPGSGVTIANIPASGASTITFQVTVNTIPNPNPIPNRGTVKYNFTIDPSIPNGGSGSGNTNTVTTQINTASIDNNGVGGNGLNKIVNPSMASTGDILTYTISLKNTGNVQATNVVLTDTIPNGTTFVANSVTVNGISVGGDPETGVNVGNLSPLQTATVVFKVQVGQTIPSPNPIPNTANTSYSFTMDPSVPNGASGQGTSNVALATINSAIINNTTGGGLVKVVDKQYASVNDVLTYTITALNTGNVTASSVIVKDTIPVGTTFIVNSVSVNGVNQPAVNPQTGISVGNIGVSSIATIIFKVKVNSTIPSPNPIPNNSSVGFKYTVIPTLPDGRTGSGTSNTVTTEINSPIIDNKVGAGFIKSVDKAYADINDTLTYTLVLANKGNVVANNLVVTDTIPNGTTFVANSVTFNGTPQGGAVIWPPTGYAILSLSPNEVATITYKVVVNTIPSPNPIPNSATVNYVYTQDPSIPNGASGVGNSNIVNTQVNNGGLDPNKGGFTKTADKDYAKVGDTITYTSVMKNTGNVSINNVVFQDTVPNGTSFIQNSVVVNGVANQGANPQSGINVGSIAPQGVTTVVFKVLVTTIPSPNPLQNVATASYTYTVDPSVPNGKPGSNSSNGSQTQINQATIDNSNGGGLVKSVDKAYAKVGDILNYTLTLKNTGNITANNVVLTDTVPTGTSFVVGSAMVNGVSVSVVSPTSGINVGDIGAGNVSTVTFAVSVVSVPSTNPIPNSGTVNYSFIVNPTNQTTAKGTGNSNTVNTQINNAAIDNKNGGGFIKGVDKQYADIGDILTYTIGAKNTGNVTANNVVLIDTIPNGTSFVVGSVNVNGVNQPNSNPQNGITLGNIAPSSNVTIVFKVTVQSIPNPNPIPNSATVGYTFTVDPVNPDEVVSGGNTNTVLTTVNNANFNSDNGGLTKTVDKAYAKVSDVLNYTIALVNKGSVTANNVIFSDTIPGGTTFVNNSVNVNGVNQPGKNPQSGVIIPSIGVGSVVTVQFAVIVNTVPMVNPIPNEGRVSYNYVVTPSIPSGKTGGNLSNIVTTQVNDPFINPANGGFIKSVDKQFATIGETITYTVVVKNTGNVLATNMSIKDTIPSGTAFVDNSVTINGVNQPGVNPEQGVSLSQMLPGEISTVTFKVLVTTIPLVNPIPNFALLGYSFTMNPSIPNGESTVVLSNGVTTQINAALIDNTVGGGLVKAVDLAYGDIGQVLTYTIGVKNTGNVTATSVIIKDTIPSGTTLVQNSVVVNGVNQPGVNPQNGVNLGTIGANKQSTIVFKVVVNTIPTPNPIPNNALSSYSFIVNPNNPTPVTFNGMSNTVNTQINNGTIDFNKGGGFVKSTDKAVAKVGDVVTYTLNLKNTGNTTVNNVVVTDTIPNGAAYISGSATVNGVPVSTVSPQSGITVGSIGPSQTSVVVFKVSIVNIPSPNPMVNSATVKYNYTVDPANPNGALGSGNSNQVTTGLNEAIIDNASGGFSKTADKQYADVGDIVTYTIVAKNTGTTAANNLVVTDTIPANTNLVQNSVTVNGIVQTGVNPQNGINVGSLGANSVATITFQVLVVSTPSPNPMENSASNSFTYTLDPANPNGATGGGNTNKAQTQINHGEISNVSGGFVKSVDKVCAGIDEIVTYSIGVKNTGNQPVNNVIVKDTIPNGMTFVQNSVQVNGAVYSGINPESGIVLNTLVPNQLMTITFKVKVTTIPASANATNIATVAYSYTVNPANPNGVKKVAASNSVVTDINSAIIKGNGFTKSVDKAFADLGDTLTYSFNITNTGNTDALSVVLYDTIPSGTTFIDGSISINGNVQQSGNPQNGIPIGTITKGITVNLVYKVKVNPVSIPNPNPIPNNADIVYSFETCSNVLITNTSSSMIV